MNKTFKFFGFLFLSSVGLMACTGTKKIANDNNYTPIITDKNSNDTMEGLEYGYSSKKKIELIDQKPVIIEEPKIVAEKPLQDTTVAIKDTIKTILEEITPPTKPIYLNPFAHLELKDTFNIALILPFNLGQTPTTLTQKQNFKFDASTKLALDYYQGFMTAIKNFNGNNLVVKVDVLDDKNDENATQSIINSGKLRNTDIIVGPIYNKNLRIMAPYAQEMEIPIFSPLSPSSNIAQNNPYYFSANAVNESIYEQIINEINKKKPFDTIYIFNEGSSEELDIIKIMKHQNEELGGNLTLLDFKINQSTDTLKIPPYFSDTLQKNIIIPNHNEAFASYVCGRLKILSKNQFSVYGLSTWIKFNKKIFTSKNLNTIIPTSTRLNNANGELDFFRNQYEMKYDKKPAEASYQAHDLVVLLANLIGKKNFHPTNGFQLLETNQLINTQYNIMPNKKVDGTINYYSNHFVYFLRFDQGSTTFIKN